jgi:hypothetical protein
VASPIEVLHSRQRRPLFQDDRSRRGEFPPRQAKSGLVGEPRLRRAALVIADIAVIAEIARDRKGKSLLLRLDRAPRPDIQA